MNGVANRRWRLARRPQGALSPGDLVLEDGPRLAPAEGEVLVENLILSIDPTNRLWLSDVDQHAEPVAVGDTVRGFVYGRVAESRRRGFAAGDLVFGAAGWESYSILARPQRLPGPPDLPLEAHASVAGLTGLTAWFGVQDLCRPKAGQTMLVSAAAGAVGSVAGQLGKLAGCRVVGVVGDDAKGERLMREYGFDAFVNRRNGHLAQDLADTCPDGIDIDFENAGGAVLDAALGLIRPGARIVICGLIAGYEAKDGWPRHDLRPILMKAARIEGLLISSYWSRLAEGAQALGDLVRDGRLAWRVDVMEGLETAPAALARVMAGENDGKMLVRLTR